MFKSLLVVLLGMLVSFEAGAPSPLSRYRDVALGESVQAVADQLELAATDVKVLHDQPSLAEELTWQPHRFVSGITAVPDPLAELVLTFYQGRLARIVAIYDRERTQGLTDADLHELVSRVYGVATLQSTPTQLPDSTLRRRTVGRWEDADHLVLLWREVYPARVGLTITSIAEDRVLQEAIAESERVAAEEAPRRAEEGRAAAAAAIRERDEKQRLGNKAQFKP